MITRKTTYALRALCHLARLPPGHVRLGAELAELEGIPKYFITGILRQLALGGIVTSARGRHGGYALRMPAAAINIAMVVRLLDGSPFPFSCLNWQTPQRCDECPGSASCPARQALSQMSDASLHTLEAISVAELAANVAPLSSLRHEN